MEEQIWLRREQQPAPQFTLFDNTGNTFNYTCEVDDETLTIWGGEKGSPAYF
jgi:hypothetical protein